jgi:hypothetical protein
MDTNTTASQSLSTLLFDTPKEHDRLTSCELRRIVTTSEAGYAYANAHQVFHFAH